MACKEDIRLLLIFKDFAMWLRSSCVGLHVAAYANAEVLNEHGIHTVVGAVRHNADIVTQIDRYNEMHKRPLTNVIISAPWLTRHELKSLLEAYPEIQFLVVCHSNVGFLQSDLSAMELIRCYHELEEIYPNIEIGGNSWKFVKWLSKAYDWNDVIYLPNLYPFKDADDKQWDGESVLKIGAFGAVRPEKNFMTAAGAALVIHRMLGVPVEFHMLKGMEHNSVSKAIKDMLTSLNGVTLVLHDWCYWDDFVTLVGSMDLLLQPSYTESFNMVTADGISMGVPSVVSSAVYWAPNSWKADSDNAVEVAEVGISLLYDYKLREKGKVALASHNRKSLKHWYKYFDIDERSWCKRFIDNVLEVFKG